MAAKPTKMIQFASPAVAGDGRIPVTMGNDGRSIALKGTDSCFVAGGPVGQGMPLYVIADPGVAAIGLTPDQVIGATLAFAPVVAGNLDINFPSAASIVAYLGSDLTRVAPGATPTNGTALTPAAGTAAGRLYESYDCYIQVFDANSTYQFGTSNVANPAAGSTFMYGGGLFANAAFFGVAAGNLRFVHLKIIIACSTPGSELVWIVPVGQ